MTRHGWAFCLFLLSACAASPVLDPGEDMGHPSAIHVDTQERPPPPCKRHTQSDSPDVNIRLDRIEDKLDLLDKCLDAKEKE